MSQEVIAVVIRDIHRQNTINILNINYKTKLPTILLVPNNNYIL